MVVVDSGEKRNFAMTPTIYVSEVEMRRTPSLATVFSECLSVLTVVKDRRDRIFENLTNTLKYMVSVAGQRTAREGIGLMKNGNTPRVDRLSLVASLSFRLFDEHSVQLLNVCDVVKCFVGLLSSKEPLMLLGFSWLNWAPLQGLTDQARTMLVDDMNVYPHRFFCRREGHQT